MTLRLICLTGMEWDFLIHTNNTVVVMEIVDNPMSCTNLDPDRRRGQSPHLWGIPGILQSRWQPCGKPGLVSSDIKQRPSRVSSVLSRIGHPEAEALLASAVCSI